MPGENLARDETARRATSEESPGAAAKVNPSVSPGSGSGLNRSTPKISILIPAFNEEELIATTIQSVRDAFQGINFDAFEIIVCDNNSTDRTADVARVSGAVVVHESHNQISRARNKAASHAAGEWLIFLDADTCISAELLRSTVDILRSRTICGGGSLVRFAGPPRKGLGDALLRFWNGVSVVFGLAAGSYVFCYREAWAEVGGFDERIYAGEELLFSRKLRRWGRKRKLGFTVLTHAPVVTSARKLEWYGSWHLLRTMLTLAWPGALKSRERCALWYKRPAPADERANR